MKSISKERRSVKNRAERTALAIVLTIALIAGTLPGAFGTAYADTGATALSPDDTVLKMSFEDDLVDASAVGNQVTASKTASYAEGVTTGTKAVNLTDSTYLNLGTEAQINPENLTLSFWIKPNGTMSGEQIFVWNKAEWYTDGWYISSESNTSPIAVSVGRANTNGQPYKVSVRQDRATFFPADTWTHVAVTYDNDTKEVGIYKNGQKQATNVDYALSSTATGVIADSTVHKSFGWNGPVHRGGYANYALDELYLYDKTGTVEDVIGLYMQGNPAFDVLESIIKPDLAGLLLSSSVSSNVILPTSGTRGTTITWTSSDSDVVNTESMPGTGVVTRPEQEEADAEVTLKATGSFAGKTFERTFSVTVLAQTEGGGASYIKDSGIDTIDIQDPYLVNAASKEAEYLLDFLDEKRFLYYFQTNAGLTPDASTGYGGWETGTGNRFQGHFVGHYLSALSQIYASLDDPAKKQKALEKATYMVNAMAAAQSAYAVKDSANAGYLSPFSVSLLPSGGSGLIVPFYNLHKVVAGLLDAYTYLPPEVGDKALDVASDFGTWVTNWKAAHPSANILGTEYGGMNEALYELYSYTGDPVHKKAAEAFDETALFNQLAAGTDALNGKHANTTIPKLTGALKRYTVMMEDQAKYDALTETEKANLSTYLQAAENFWTIVQEHHSYANGGNSQSEHFHAPDTQGQYAVSDSNTAETCNVYNMLKLSRELFKITGDKKYADYYEQAYLNAIIASQNPETAMTMYFQPMGPGYSKIFGPADNNFWCCQGTGIENFTKLGDSNFFTYKDRIYANIYSSSTFSDKAHNAKIELTANFPNEDVADFKVSVLDSAAGGVAANTKLYLRMPEWAKQAETVLTLNSKVVDLGSALITSGRDKGYISVAVTAGDEISIKLPQKLTYHTTPDKPDLVAFQYGAYLLVAPQKGTLPVTNQKGSGILVQAAVYDGSVLGSIEISTKQQEWLSNLEANLVRVEDRVTPTGNRVQFKLNNVGAAAQALTFEPYMTQYEERYGVYMYLASPDSPESQNTILAKKQELRDSEFASDVVAMFDNNNYEFQRGLKTNGTSNVGTYNGRQYRDATGTGSWFSYDLAYPTGADKVYLRTMLTTADNGRSFNIYINDNLLQNLRVNNSAGTNVFYQQYVEIPKAYIDESSSTLTVKYAKDSTSSPVGGIYGVAITAATSYDDVADIKALSFDVGELERAPDPESTDCTLTIPKGTEQVLMSVTPHMPSGLIYVDGVLIDDTIARTVDVKGVNAISIKAYAQDHTTFKTYTITLAEADVVPATGLIADYSFAKAPADGTTVDNLAAGSTFGPALVQNADAAVWANNSLVFAGGGTTNNTTANWVRLPNNILSGKTEATIAIEVKADSSMLNNWNFLWCIGNSGTTQHWFSSVRNNPAPRATLKTSRTSNAEVNARSSEAIDADRWYSLTSTITSDGTMSIYLDGKKVGEAATGSTPADITNQTLNAIGRAPYNDPLFKGAVSTFRVYDRALTGEEVAQISDVDANLHKDEIEASAQDVLDKISSVTVDDSTLVLPNYGGLVEWISNTKDIEIAADGTTLTVEQPKNGQPNLNGMLTARVTLRGIVAIKTVPVTVKPEAAPEDVYGYLMVHFIEDSAGYQEKIYLDISRGDNPEQWDPLNGGKAILASDKNSTGLRDPFLTYNPETKTYYIIATDLRVFGGDNAGWGAWSNNYYTTMNVWESKDLVHWSDQRQFDVELDKNGNEVASFGMMWAPEATWVPDYYEEGKGAFIVYWSSQVGGRNDGYYGVTTDFSQETYEYGGQFTFPDASLNNNIDASIRQVGNTTYRVRGSGAIILEKTTAAKWWLPETAWTRVQTGVGREYSNSNEGALTFKSNQEDKWYCYVDVIPSGYQPLVSTNLDNGFGVLESSDFYMKANTKHGGVISLTKAQYDAIRASDVASAVKSELGQVDLDNGSTPEQLLSLLPDETDVNLAYGRGTEKRSVDWDISNVKTGEEGVYTAKGTVDTLGSNLNEWIGAGGSVAWDAPDKTKYSGTALTVTMKVVVGSPVVVDPEDLVAHYPLISDVKDTSQHKYDGQTFGAVSWEDGLTLTGGSSTGPYAELPGDVFKGSEKLTISFWLKSNTPAGNYAALYFGTPANSTNGRMPTGYWLFNPTNPSGLFKSVFTNSTSASAPYGTEVGVSSGNTTGNRGVWTNYTTVITENSVTGYVNGSYVGTNTNKTRTIASFGSVLNAFIGKSNYLDDQTFAGSFRELTIYSSAKTGDEVKAIYDESYTKAYLKLKEASDALTIGNTHNVIDDLTLPTSGLNGVTIAWKSSDSAVIAEDGTVALASEAKTVTLTATLSLDGNTLTKVFTVTLPAKDGIAKAFLDEIFVPYRLADGDTVDTEVAGYDVTWTSMPSNVVGTDGKISVPEGVTEATLTARIVVGTEAKTKVFAVKLLGSTKMLLGYTRTGSSPNLSSLHLAIESGEAFDALNHNAGVLFPKADFTENTLNGVTKVLASPYIFRMKDGSFGVVATRMTAGGSRSSKDLSGLLIFTSDNLVSYNEVGLIDIAGGKTINNPVCEVDAETGAYNIWFEDAAGTTWRVVTTDFESFEEATLAVKPAKRTAATSIAGAVPSNVLPVTAEEIDVLTKKFAPITNTSVSAQKDVFTVDKGSSLTSNDLGDAIAKYSDGSEATKQVDWDLTGVDFNNPGNYSVIGTVKRTVQQFPLGNLTRRADPNIIHYNGMYYFISTDDNGQAQFYVRKSDTIEGLGTAIDNRILRVSTSAPVQDMMACLWAPEFHVIGGELYIFFAGSPTDWSGVSSRVMKLNSGGDPTVAADWGAPTKVLQKDGSVLYSGGITLDMTTFSHDGEEYAIWAQRQMNPTGPSDLFIATIDENEPWKLTSEPVRISTPEYSWDRHSTIVDEGAYVLKNGGKLYLTFSGNNVNDTYCVGMMTADESSDLLDPASWTKSNYPLLDSASLPNQYGPGHNSYFTDEHGVVYNVFHAQRTSSGTRDAGVRLVHFGKDGTPVLDLASAREVADANLVVITTIKVKELGSGADTKVLELIVKGAERYTDLEYSTSKVAWDEFVKALDGAKAIIKAPEDYTVDEATAAGEALTAAMKAVDDNSVDSFMLGVYIEIAEDMINEPEYAAKHTKSSRAAFEGALAAAKAVLDSRVSQTAIEDAITALEDARDVLYEKGDVSELNTLVSSVNGTLKASDWTVDSWEKLTKALSVADAVLTLAADDDASIYQVEYAMEVLWAAVDGLQPKPPALNFLSLDSAILTAQGIVANASQYVATSITGLPTAITVAQGVRTSATTQAQINAATTALAREIAKARKKADLSSLEALLGNVTGLNLSLYTQSSVTQLAAIANEAADLVARKDSIDVDAQLAVNAAYDRLIAALGALVPIANTGNAYDGGTDNAADADDIDAAAARAVADKAAAAAIAAAANNAVADDAAVMADTPDAIESSSDSAIADDKAPLASSAADGNNVAWIIAVVIGSLALCALFCFIAIGRRRGREQQ